MILDGSTFTRDVHESCDVVVIGSGAGGAVVAKELSEGGMKVIIVEEGAHHPTSSHRDLPYSAVRRMYRNRAYTTTLGTPIIPVPMGRALGGTTVINSGTCFRTPRRVLQHWNTDLGLDGLTEEALAPFFERVEKEIHVEESDFSVMSRVNIIMHELLAKKGIQGHALRRNIRDCEGCGFCCYGCPSGAKQSMDVCYLPKAFSHGARAYTNAKVGKILTSKSKADGIEAEFLTVDGRETGVRLNIKAPIVIVAAGTVFSPGLLRRSGIGVRNRNLGRNLTLHPATKVFAEFDEEIRGWEGTPQAYHLDIFEKDEGITFEGVFIPPDVAAMNVPFIGKQLVDFMHNYSHMASFGFLIADSTTGRVVNLPFLGESLLYNFTPYDVARMRKGVAFLSRLFLEGGAKRVYTLLHGYSELSSLGDVEKLEQGPLASYDIEGMAFHPLGTCRMASVPKLGVVGPDNQVFGWDGIYVCDGSIIPSSLGVNPQVTIMMFATRLASMLLSQKGH